MEAYAVVWEHRVVKHSQFSYADATVTTLGTVDIFVTTPPPANRIDPVGHWSLTWQNANHTQASATWVPEKSGQIVDHLVNSLNSGHTKLDWQSGDSPHFIGPEAAGLGAYLGIANMIGQCSVAVYTGLSGNPTVVASGVTCANALAVQSSNGNLQSVLSDIAYSEANEMDAMSGGLAGVADQLDSAQGTGPESECGADGTSYGGTSGGNWGNGDTFSCGTGPGLITIRIPPLNQVVGHH